MPLATRSKPKAHHKKRQGLHHRRNKRYVKTYLPYLPMLVIVGLGCLINSVWSHSAVLGSQSDFSASSLLSSTNDVRASNHEPGLSLNPELAAAAQAKANDMVQHNYWAHNAPDGKTPWAFITATGYQYQAAGENLAYGFNSAGAVTAGWMNSPEHRANVLSATYRDVGFGVAQSTDYQSNGPQTVVVAEYAEPANGSTHISFSVPTTASNTGLPNVQGDQTELPARPVSRIQVLTAGQASWSLLALSACMGAAAAVFVVRHGYRLRRSLNRGEAFIVHHPWLDVAVVLVITAGFILTRTSGIIR